MRALLLVPLAACASEARLPASYFAEGGNTLRRGDVAVTAAAGGGATSDGKGVGGGGRVRVGIGHDQEIGIEAAGVRIDAPGEHCSVACDGDPDTRFTAQSTSALLSFKREIRPELAVLVGIGGSRHRDVAGDTMPNADASGTSVDATLGLVRSWHVNRGVGVYLGLRGALAVPVETEQSAKARTVLGFTSALGGDLLVAPHLHLYLEGGPRASWLLHDGPTIGVGAVVGFGLVL